MSDLFRDVDEALQRDRMARMWKQYGPVLVLGAVLLIVATGAVSAYRAWSAGQKREATTELVNAAEDKDAAPKLEKFAADAKGNYKVIAAMNAAGKAAEASDFTKAAELYLQVADDKNAPAELHDLANMYYARAIQLRAGEAKLDYKELTARLDPVAANDKSPFQLQAKLDAALLYGDALGDHKKALELLKGFDGPKVPDSLKEKASALKHIYDYELAKTTPAANKE